MFPAISDFVSILSQGFILLFTYAIERSLQQRKLLVIDGCSTVWNVAFASEIGSR